MFKLRSLSLVLVAFLAACSGGGSDSAPSSAQSLTQSMLISTDSGSEIRVEALVDAAMLEREDGSMTGDLLGGSRVIALADPLGRPELLTLTGMPSGTYKALHLVVRGMTAIDGRGATESVKAPSVNVSFLLDPGSRVGVGDTLRLRHSARLALRKDAKGRANWNPSLALAVGEVAPLRHAHVELTTVDENTGLIEGLLQSFGATVTLRFDVLSDALVVGRDPWRAIDTVDIYKHLAVGQRVTVEGWVTHDRVLQLTYLELPPRHEPDHRLFGWVSNLDAKAESFDIHVIEFLSTDSVVKPRVYRVEAGAAHIHRTGSPHLSLPFSSLEEGDNVIVEWADPWSGGTIYADRVELQDGSAGDPNPMTMGAVGSVDVSTGKIVMIPWNGKPLMFEGSRVSTLELNIDSRSLIYRRSKKSPVDLGSLVVGQKLWIRGRVTTGQAVDIWELRINR